MDRRHLEYFLAVADHEGFTRAAHALHVAQPSLSQAIKLLERELGVELFNRLGHRIRLTPAGEALVGPARQALRDFEAARTAVLNVEDLQSGRLDIVAVPALAADPLAQLVGRFHAHYPGVLTRIADPGSADILDRVRTGESELALTMGPPASDLNIIEFPLEDIFLALPPEAPQEPLSAVPAKTLETLDLIVTTATKAFLIQVLSEIGVTPTFSVETAHREAIVPLVLSGVGGALLPPLTARAASVQGAVVCRVDPPVTRRVLLVYRRASLTPAARAFLNLVQDFLADGSRAACAWASTTA